MRSCLFAVFIVTGCASQSADKISTGDFEEPEFNDKGKDEVAVLGSSFNRMRRSLEKAMQMIGEQ